jgi:hypothetical protein
MRITLAIFNHAIDKVLNDTGHRNSASIKARRNGSQPVSRFPARPGPPVSNKLKHFCKGPVGKVSGSLPSPIFGAMPAAGAD